MRKEAEEKERLVFWWDGPETEFTCRLLKEQKLQENALKKKQGDDKQNAALREKLSKARAEEEERMRTSAANIPLEWKDENAERR